MLTWSVLIRSYGLHDAFFQSGSREPLTQRLSLTVSGAVGYLHIAPAAIVVLLLGSFLLRRSRQEASVGHPAWLWSAVVAGMALLVGTYVFGSLDIHYWLSSSLNRTMIFPQLLLYTDIAAWVVVSVLPTHTDARFARLAALERSIPLERSLA
jgi:hypothetical protein